MISGLEEARLIFAAVRAERRASTRRPRSCIDIGGGSVELMIGDASGLRWADERAARRRAAHRRARARRPAVEGRPQARSRSASATALEPLVADVAAGAPRHGASARAARSTTSRAWRSPPATTARCPPTANGLRIDASTSSARCNDRIMRIEGRRTPPPARARREAGRAAARPASTLLVDDARRCSTSTR